MTPLEPLHRLPPPAVLLVVRGRDDAVLAVDEDGIVHVVAEALHLGEQRELAVAGGARAAHGRLYLGRHRQRRGALHRELSHTARPARTRQPPGVEMCLRR